ncbi:hypothetical protein AQJ23_00130 [Streptomyces antibioticus]|nr:NACHT domain-containing protein [Streptomyces antibioticus]KUN29241.1 hypothetical protein AQJ23_00130 [Streptomyces antibioticus]
MAGLGGRRRRRNWQLIAILGSLAIAASTAYAIRQLAHGGLEPADTAGLLGLPLGVAGFMVAVMALRKQVEGNDAELARSWAVTLAAQVEDGESAVWRQLLGDDTRRINLAYQLYPSQARPATAPPAGRLADDGTGTSLPDVVSYYRATRPLRLVITGAAGAGKTVLALELLLALIDGRQDDDPVPVRIPLSRWDTEQQTLPDLLQLRLIEAYDWPKDLATGLVRHRMVLPVLDGLDEMDPLQPDGSPDPAAPRATAVIRALNAYQHGRDAGPLILTCRTHHYDALTAHTAVLDAAHITIAPTTPEDARTYLKGRAIDRVRWQPLIDHLTDHPGGPLAATLSTPWRLCLTATAYHRDGDPAELLTLPAAAALDQHLLARYIPAAIRIAPNPHRYRPHSVHRWLHHLTTHLDPDGGLHLTTPAHTEVTDLVLHDLWPLAGTARVRVADGLLTTLAAFAPLPLALTSPQPTIAWPLGALAVLGGASAVPAGGPLSVDNPFSTPQARRRAIVWLALGLTGGGGLLLGVGLFSEIAVGPMIAVATTLGIGLTIGLALGITGTPRTTQRARTIIRSDTMAGLNLSLAFGLTGGLAASLSFAGLTAAAFGLTIGLVAGLVGGAGATRRYVVFLLCSRRRLPFRLGRFLDWAVSIGLLRNSGPAYQYRHSELQHWLRQHPQPPTSR